jgi:hypothetical protein
MKHDTKREVFENQALAPLTRKLFDGSTVPNEIRWTHAEHETTLEGKSGYGKVRFAELPWAHATSKPFGSVFKPKRPNEDVRLERDKTVRVRRLTDIKPVIPTRKVGPEVLVCAGATKFDEAEHAVKVAEKIRAISERGPGEAQNQGILPRDCWDGQGKKGESQSHARLGA